MATGAARHDCTWFLSARTAEPPPCASVLIGER